MDVLCELYEAQAACGRYFVRELTSKVKSRMKCMRQIMAMLGTRTTVADLCMFGLVPCDEGGPGFVNASVRTVTNARQVGRRMQSGCTSTHRHVRINANHTSEKMKQQLREDQQELKKREQQKKARDARRIRGINGETHASR